MLNVYYPNAMILIVLAIEASGSITLCCAEFFLAAPNPFRMFLRLLLRHSIFAMVLLVCLLPTFNYALPYLRQRPSNLATFAPRLELVSPRFLAVLSPPITDSSPGRPFYSSPSLCFLFSGAGNTAPALPFSQPFSLSTFLSTCYPDWPASLPMAIAFLFPHPGFSFLGLAVFFDRAANWFPSSVLRSSLRLACLRSHFLERWPHLPNGERHLIPARGPVLFF